MWWLSYCRCWIPKILRCGAFLLSSIFIGIWIKAAWVERMETLFAAPYLVMIHASSRNILHFALKPHLTCFPKWRKEKWMERGSKFSLWMTFILLFFLPFLNILYTKREWLWECRFMYPLIVFLLLLPTIIHHFPSLYLTLLILSKKYHKSYLSLLKYLALLYSFPYMNIAS